MEIEKIKEDLIKDKRLIELNRLKMAITESTLKNKEKKLILRDKQLKKKIKDIKNKTIKKDVPIFFDTEMKKTKRKKNKRNKRKNRKTKSKLI